MNKGFLLLVVALTVLVSATAFAGERPIGSVKAPNTGVSIIRVNGDFEATYSGQSLYDGDRINFLPTATGTITVENNLLVQTVITKTQNAYYNATLGQLVPPGIPNKPGTQGCKVRVGIPL